MDIFLVKIGLGRGLVNPIYHQKPVVKGVCSNPSIFINQPMGIWDIYDAIYLIQ